LQFYYQQIMPRCQELIQLFFDGAVSTAKKLFCFWIKQYAMLKKRFARKRDYQIQKDILYQCASLLTSKKHIALSIVQENK